ncbi:PHD-zinc-finger like domain [Phytophthora infestans]|uniref:PHD-zinc-finger like domain n=1 Tax=Phytophthora infestans TaxID=4787 RepID=A0A8S9U8E6_PHYIN|nr:PHD-zinc-finger like domain [Phytophthora infestans]
MEEDEWDDALLSEITALEKRHLQTRTQQNQTQSRPTASTTTSVSSPSSGVWSCRSCTLQNEASRASCQVCSTLRGKVYQETAPTPARKSAHVQARLSFDGTSAPVAVPPSQPQRQRDAEQDVGRSVPSPFIVRDRDQAIRTSQETTLGSAASGSGLVLTSRRSEQVSGAATAKRPASSPVQMSRHAAGEDSQARNRYLDIVARSNFPQIDYEAAQHFVYPTNYAIRDYQLAIAEKALYHNTLVSLPTGLGKTLVAAVVMYNFYRWFPTGKIVFMAPTKPLVAQQIKACHEIMGIPLSDTAELQGNVPPTMRRVLWDSRRVFFCTPQSLQNDLRRGVCAAEKFVCIVVDEAHRATGNYAYCCVVQEIEAKTPFFRVLALSATPGAKFDVIQDVVTNLRISHIESRSADDSDVKKYTHARQEEVIVCRLGAQIMEIKAQFLKFFTPIIQRLLRGDIIHNSDPEKLSSWYVLQAREKFRKSPNYASNRSAESDLALLVSLLHAKSLLTGHGLSSFRDQIMSWMEERKKGKMSWSKREMLQSPEFQALEASLAVTDDSNSSSNTNSHPKLVKLRQVLLEHFQRHSAGGSSTRAIVFTQYRASVSEIVALLRPLAPLLNAQPFIGQGATGKAKENKGQSQKVQQEIVRRFRLGEFNVLVATCIAEEGLDIGEVDLIVSFDALTSPVRMIQRMGRTGRKRVGRVIILVTEGDEQKKLARSASAAKTVSRALTTFKSRFTYSKCPRMIPTGICPQLRELEMKIPTFHASQVGGKTASVAVDPSLWQLSDAERAVALMKYFPPNFASSSRNKLFPVVANRGHLLRRQPRSLVQTSVGARVGYSTRSLMLQGLVRKIHGVEEILETASDDDEEKSEADGDKTVAEVSQNSKQSGGESNRKKHRRIRASTDNAETDSEVGSPWRQPSTPMELDGDSRCEESFSAMNESLNSFDMHFSPQFVDSATQFASADEEILSKDGTKRRQHDLDMATAKKQKTNSSVEEVSRVESLSNVSTSRSANESGVRVLTAVPSASGDHNLKEKSQQMLATLSLTLTSDSPRPPHSARKSVRQQENAEESDTAQPLVDAPRPRSTRQLQFDDEVIDANLQDQATRTDLPPPKPTSETQQQPEKQVTSEGEDEDNAAFSFALLPLETSAEVETIEGSEAEEEASALSFALLSSLNTGSVAASTRPSPTASPQPVEDGTDGDEADEALEEKPAAKNELDISVVDLTEKDDHDTSVGKMVNREGASLLFMHPTGDKHAAQQAAQSQPEEAEQEEDESCAVCLESESYDDDPIVFCDGCNVAVHQFCYGIRSVPHDKWFCDVCTDRRAGGVNEPKPSQPRCQLCPHRGGAYKRTTCGQWVHVQCFLWIPEFRVEQGRDDMLVLGNLSRLDPDRKTLDCCLCHSRKGNGIIQCAHKRCLAAFHVSCAAFAHYRMDQLDPPKDEDRDCGTLFLAYCPLHRNSTAPVTLPEQHKTHLTPTTRPSEPSQPTRVSSPSHLLASPSSVEAKKKFKTFRRLKRKYDASQSQMFSQPGAKAAPVSSSPWQQKRIRRSKRRRETSRVLAAAYIDDAADVRGARGDDDDEDDYGDDYKDAADDSFINDSSQLLYSQSVVSLEVVEANTSKKKRKKSSPNMRAIYARSLFESQSSPLLLRRGGRQLGALPTNGIIRACLDELHNGSNDVDTPSPRPRSRSRVSETTEDAATLSALSASVFSASATVTEPDGDDSATEAEPSPSFKLLGAAKPLQTVQEEESATADCEVAPPCFSLLGTGSSANTSSTVTSRPQRWISSTDATVPARSTDQPSNEAQDTSDELHKKIKANRLKALKKLEERRQARLQQAHARPLNNSQSRTGFTSAAALVSNKTEEEAGAMSFNLLGSSTSGLSLPATPTRAVQSSLTSTIDLTSPKLAKPGSVQQPKWVIFVSSGFASSSSFPAFLSAKHADCTVAIVESMEADALLSVRTAVLFLTGEQLHEVARASPAHSVVKSRRVGMLLAMHKKLIIAVTHDVGDLPEVHRLRQFPNATVIVQPRVESLCTQLHEISQRELAEGYELPSPSQCRQEFKGGVVRGLDADFALRLKFFRSISPLSLGSALSLSFRFKNFPAMQVPVLKFNEMHWRRMLPWISETTAEEIREHVQQNVRR